MNDTVKQRYNSMKKLSLLILSGLLIQFNILSQPCLPNLYIVINQVQIDSFQTNYPNCTEIQGDVWIEGNNITNLNGLNVLTAIWGNLRIDNNGNLTTLSGLDNIDSIGGDLLIRGNNTLTSLTGLDNLTSVGGSLRVESNFSLINLTGLDGLNYIYGNLNFYNNIALTSLSALNNVIYIGNLSISGNPALPSLTGLDNVTYINGNLSVYHNNVLSTLTGLDNLTSIIGNLNIWDNSSLISLAGLDNLTSIGDYLDIQDNHLLKSLTGLNNLTTIGDNLSIWNNIVISSLSSLNNLTSIGGDLMIFGNESLKSLNGLENIDVQTIGKLKIYNNDSLGSCEVQSVCDYLASPIGTVEIHDNAPGCNSQAEVDSACATVSVENRDFRNMITLFPNPAEKDVFISGKDRTTINEVNIYNQLGQKVLKEIRPVDVIDVSVLEKGIYVVEVVTGEWVVREKLIIR